MFTLIGFCFFTLFLFYLSRRALRKVGSHGFYRFFAWEALLVLIFLNADAWFKDPLSWYQDISWVLLIISLILAAEGFRLLRRMGGHHALREDPTLMGFEKTEHLVTSGLYAYIRHPLYGSLLLLCSSRILPGLALCLRSQRVCSFCRHRWPMSRSASASSVLRTPLTWPRQKDSFPSYSEGPAFPVPSGFPSVHSCSSMEMVRSYTGNSASSCRL